MKRIWMLLLAFLLLIYGGIPANAVDMGSDGDNITLTIEYKYEGKNVENANVMLYKIASIDQSFRITVDRRFRSFRGDIENQNTDWSVLADGLIRYIQEKNIPCDDMLTIGAVDRPYQFPTEGKTMQPGIYLLYSSRHIYNEKIFYPSPVIISLPNFGENGQLSNAICAKMKYSVCPDCLIRVVAKKQWDDRGYENKRPASITVQLVKDGQVVPNSSKTLSKSNNWTAEWTDLDPLPNWSVKETRIVGYAQPQYTKKYTCNTRTFTIINTYKPGNSTPGNPNSGNKLPQTGQLDWPIPWMTVSGMVLFTFGWWLCFGRKESE